MTMEPIGAPRPYPVDPSTDGARSVGAPDRGRPGPEQPDTSHTSEIPSGSEGVPTGTDPALWEVLSQEEKSFFASLGSLGGLTYGPEGSDSSTDPAPLGGRIDVRV